MTKRQKSGTEWKVVSQYIKTNFGRYFAGNGQNFNHIIQFKPYQVLK